MKLLFFVLVIICLYFFVNFLKRLDNKKLLQINQEKQKKIEEEKIEKEKSLKKLKDSEIKKIDDIKEKWHLVLKMKIYNVGDFKKNIIENEKLIVEKDGDKQLYLFLKIDSFLNDYRNKIILDRNEISLDDPLFDNIKNLINSKTYLVSGELKNYLKIDDFFEARNKTLEYYENIANSMLIFYLNDNKILYYEIYEAFEKLGVFDSSWQKLILKKMEDIHNVLEEMNDCLSELNYNFENLITSTETIVDELNSINSSVKTGNMIQAISAYQSWRINRKINN